MSASISDWRPIVKSANGRRPIVTLANKVFFSLPTQAEEAEEAVVTVDVATVTEVDLVTVEARTTLVPVWH
jgi:hypothetical protein